MKKYFLLSSIAIACTSDLYAQIDNSLLKRHKVDTTERVMNMDAVYNRPFLNVSKTPVSLGGYMEAYWRHTGTEGVSDGHQFVFPRMTLFVSSTISERIKFLSELEIEDGGKNLAIEFAAVDLEFHRLLNLRAGIIMNPIGAFNQNHDGPKWEFSERPIAMTQILPATWSNAGFGIYGKHNNKDWMLGYEAYLTGGFDNSIISNEMNKTYLPAAKANPNRFEEIASGVPLFTGKIAMRNKKIGEIGLSYMGGVYNQHKNDGEDVEEKMKLNTFVVDFNTTLPFTKTFITGEWVWIAVAIPETYTQQFGSKQYGGFLDIVHPLWKRKMFGWKDAIVNLACRLEYADWNIGHFRETGGKIYDELWSIMSGISFRPNAQTVLRFNYRYQEQRDLLGNPSERTGGFTFGVATYF